MGRRTIILAIVFSIIYTPLVFVAVDGVINLTAGYWNWNSGLLQDLRTAVIIVLLLVPVAILVYLDYHAPAWKKVVHASGQGAWGVVTKIDRLAYNRNYVNYLGVALEVRPAGAAPFKAKLDLPAFSVAGLDPGNSVYVKYDPQNQRHILLAEPPDSADQAGAHATHLAPSQKAAAHDLTSQLERLAKLQAAGQLTPEEFEAAKHKLLS